MIFSDVAKKFNEINQESSRLKITQLLAELFANATSAEAHYLSYLCLGTLRAPYHFSQFNFAEKNIVKTLAIVINKDREFIESELKKSGDIGFTVLSLDWPYVDTGMTVTQVYEKLLHLQGISGTGSQEEKAEFLINILSGVDALSASYIIRIIMGTMRLGFSDMTLIDALSWMITGDKSLHKKIESTYNLCADIGIIAHYLSEHGMAGLEYVKPQIGIPIRPAAAERSASAQDVIGRLGPCVAQPKLDGFRLQIHVDNAQNEFKTWFFSRNLIDMTGMFPDLSGLLKDLAVNSLIIEGEAIVYDEDAGTFLPFQETVKRKRKHDIEEVAQTLPLHFFIFDILYLNGEVLIDKTHAERRALTQSIFKAFHSDKIQVIEEQAINSVSELDAYLNEQITKGLEGIVVKRIDAVYQPGKRNFNWIKLKRSAVGTLTDTIDAVVLGYYAGKGKRTDFGIGAFLVGVYNKDKDRYESVAKIGTGLTDLEFQELKLKCDAQKVLEQPHNVICSKELAPDVWVNPSIVVVVRADEITQSPMHAAGSDESTLGLALRFPRFMGYSLDKSPEQATSVFELRELYNLQYIISQRVK